MFFDETEARAPRHAAARPEAMLICFSHLRWDLVFQRPQHLMTRLARTMPVIYWEEPLFTERASSTLQLKDVAPGVTVATPLLPERLAEDERTRALEELLEELLGEREGPLVRWYYTPMMLPFSAAVPAKCTVYDCMDELANFRFAPPELVPLERELLACSDLVFTGGYSLYEAKKDQHPSVHPFPSSVDVGHFNKARGLRHASALASGDRPRLGYYGVIDERMDLGLLAGIADARPEWDLEIIGPVVKISEEDLPRRPNLHYTGSKNYSELPACAAAWDVALMPFAINDATRFISPTKTPEYLAAGLPVVSTPIADVIRHYGDMEGVRIAATCETFVAACEESLDMASRGEAWREEADEYLSSQSWDQVAARMLAHIRRVAEPDRPHLVPVNNSRYDYLVVGAGFAGSVMAERLAEDAGKRVLVIDRRDHVGGNAYDLKNDAGLLIHQYGPHIFHTNSEAIFSYLSRFTSWLPYEHRVLAQVDGQLVPIPINRTTINQLYGLSLSTDAEAAAFYAERAEPTEVLRTSEDVVVGAVGRELYEKFFRGYTRKQWGMDPSELDKSVTARVPTRTNTDDRYFGDRFQYMPKDGYTAMFERMLDHPNIDVRTGVDFERIRDRVEFDRLVYTGPIDEFFGHRFGKLPYRSLEFRHETIAQEWLQPVAVINYPEEDVPYTRVTEYKHLTGQESRQTSVTYEYARAEGDPYYPIPRPENQALYKRYEALAEERPDVLFVGRLATYRYYNMDQVVGQALATYRRHVETIGASQVRETVLAAE